VPKPVSTSGARTSRTVLLPPRIFIFGAGKVGIALARAAKARGFKVRLRAARKGLPRSVPEEFVILAVRDGELRAWAEQLTARISPEATCVHTAGSLRSEALDALRPFCRGVAQMHPMISFASKTAFPALLRGNLHVEGDRVAVTRAKAFGRALGMSARSVPGLDTVGYHAAAGLVANGAAALAAMGAQVLVASGVQERDACKMLGPLLRSVAENIEMLGFPAALTGPVRRGDANAVERHAAVLAARLPEVLPLYRAAVAAQIPLAKQLAEAPAENFAALEQWSKRRQ
jgi:predicted short-subunit dehydrogenase-like oxidoreductase (DUF2520 family)